MIESEIFAGKVALVTGGASGIGRATAMAFASQGASVAVADIDRQSGEGLALVRQIKEQGGRAVFVPCDVSREADVAGLVPATLDAFGRLDAAFNNAGIQGECRETHTFSEEGWSAVLGINLTGVWRCMRAEIEYMLEHGGGSIVNCSSAAGITGVKDYSVYSASKHGVIGLTRSSASEYASRGIRINAVCPGVIDTPMFDRLVNGDDAIRAAVAAQSPIGRAGDPEEVAEAVLWLSSPAASFVVGHALLVDGGWSA